MRPILALTIAVLCLTHANHSRADDISKVMCEQFAISGAEKTVKATTELDEDFVPLHHAPRNIPIDVSIPANTVAYVHFPIVEDGTYAIYATDPGRLAGLKQKDGNVISAEALDAPAACADVLKGGLTADVNVGKLTGPRPIAIEFKKGAAETIRFIVSRNPIN